MLLGKRARPSMRRTTSMAGFTDGDQSNLEAPRPLEPQRPIHDFEEGGPATPSENIIVVCSRAGDHRSGATFSPRYHRTSRGDSVETTADFLRTCGLCKRRLSLARDIYMYRGDTAFCSLECREQQMNLDERKEKRSICMVASKNDELLHHNRSPASPEASTKSQKVAAA
ncbi:hypothetical protein RJ639_035516 [Escallonia herrerae]|uniref:FLZ-type domain-containing protein n=1 Tax=Escallonia herrerae TaxID=1293975 RepID=A0AA88WPB1_9ASTE|nr:hypothetical protein RJ639_035516 [Escallonia herrerae]